MIRNIFLYAAYANGDIKFRDRRKLDWKMKNAAKFRPALLSSAPSRIPVDYLSNPTSTTLSSALQHYINSPFPSHGQKLYTHILKTGFNPNTNISIKLLILHLKCDFLIYARRAFDELPHPTASAYNYMIGGYIKHGMVEDSVSLVRKMVLSGSKPDGFTFSMILKASTSGSDASLLPSIGKEVHARIIRSEVDPDDVLSTALVDSYVKGGNVGYARIVFDTMLEKNVVCSTSMISGYMNQGCVEEAEIVFAKTRDKDVVVFNAMIEGYSKTVDSAKKSLETYIDMQRLGFKPTLSTFSSIIGACALFAVLEVGQQVQGQLMKTDLFEDIRAGSALIDMYCKCGKTEDARRVFDQMQHRNVFSWTSMIDGYGKNGDTKQALELFDMLRRQRSVEPNNVTFLGALSACGHAGLVAKGLEIFESMERYYRMKPRMEHYACMVDLLGRAGRLQQAREFVMAMPENPNADVWAALLSSCRLHGEVEMAKFAAHELFKLNVVGRPGAYVAFSNTLADAARWDNVSELRDAMKEKGISKDTARSWIGVDSG